MIRVHESNDDVLKNIARVNKKLEETFHNLDTYARRVRFLGDAHQPLIPSDSPRTLCLYR